jgi:signal transduction histidine kinase
VFNDRSIPFGDKTRPSASLVYVPLRNDTQAIGVVSIQSYKPNTYNEGDLRALQALADHCGGALERIQAEQENEQLKADLEQRVRERTAQLETLNRELEAFSYSVSHDLRAPVRSIQGFSEVVLQRYGHKLDARGQEFLRRACDSCHQMNKLIEDLLDLSRVGRRDLLHQHVNLSMLAESILADLRRSDPKRKVRVRVAKDLEAEGDERFLRLVLENLLRNAWKFTNRRPEAHIEFGQTDGPTPAFFVRDDGAGFDMAHADRLFGVFQRFHSDAEFPGSGVGLATVQRIISRHGGRVWAVGEVNCGATFYFTLPGMKRVRRNSGRHANAASYDPLQVTLDLGDGPSAPASKLSLNSV